MQIEITDEQGHIVVYNLNDSQAAQHLLEQLPLRIAIENYGHNEKIFYPPEKLTTTNTPLADAKHGSLAYYAPWGDVVLFYKDFGTASGLYELGYVSSGKENISLLAGTISIERIDD